MERKKQYSNNEQVEQDLYQYEMGIELGADIEAEKNQHANEYQQERACHDFKSEQNNNQLNQSNNQNQLNQQKRNNEQNRNNKNNQNQNQFNNDNQNFR